MAQASRPRPQAPTGANQVWAYDFVFDRCANGQQLKCLTVTDEPEVAIDVDGRVRSARVIEVLARLVSERGAPLYLRSDNVLRRENGISRATDLRSLIVVSDYFNVIQAASAVKEEALGHSEHRVLNA